ncbi:hypothetical protein [Alicyclobacillus acidiphilus]|uniref:hypothetical protein n=1 Tax=Alicyclobacillus acidiphilus TaxID=182455 RepID=UPI00082DD5AB|nr:hypothetical protein [Alicyclobacillus acidiphilus]
MAQTFPFRLVVEGERADRHRLPIRLYGQLLSQFQDVIYLIGASVEGMTLSSRGPLPSAILDTYSLEVSAEEKGSFAVEFEFAETEQLPIYEQNRIQVAMKFEEVLDALAHRDVQKLYTAIPNSALRRRILRGMNEVGARAGSDYRLSFVVPSSVRRWTLDDDVRQWVTQTLHRTSWKRQQEMWGKIIEVRVVNEFRFVILSRGTETKCSFEEDLLSEVLTNTGGIVRVSGEAVYTDKGLDRYHVDSLEPVATGTTSVSVIQYGDHRYELSEYLAIEVDYDDAEELWELRAPALHISVVGSDVSYAFNEFCQDFDMLWKEYALADDEDLAESGRRLKQYIHELVAATNVEE